MYKAVNYWAFGGKGETAPFDFIDWAAGKGLDGVELTVGDVIPTDITEEECRKIARYADGKHIGLRSIATGLGWKYNLGTTDEGERREAIDFTKRYLQIGAWIGAEVALVVPGATRIIWDSARPVVPYKACWEQATKSIKELIPVAERLRVVLAIENVWNRFLISPMEWKFFLEQFTSDYVGMYFDVANCCLNCRPQDFPEIVGHYIKAVHLKNFEEMPECGGGTFPDDLLKGVVDFKAVFAELQKVGYNGPSTAEVMPAGDSLPDFAFLDKIAAQVIAL